MDSIQNFETILQYGSRDTTYKFGLLMGIVDYVIANPLQPAINNFHLIPIFYLSKQFLAYYSPLINDNIRQGPIRETKKSIKLETIFENFHEDIKDENQFNFPVTDSSSINLFYVQIDSEKISQTVVRLLFQIRKTILDQPLQYIRNLKGKKVTFFGLLSEEITFQSSFDKHRKAGLSLKWETVKSARSWEEVEKLENCYLFLSHQGYREISDLRFWLRDVLIKRWAEECIERFDCRDPSILTKFDLWKQIPKRNSVLIQRYHQYYNSIKLDHCLYCDSSLKESTFHLDHLIPWSRFPVNRFWNLYPVCRQCNSRKSDKIPALNRRLIEKIRNHLTSCVHNVQIPLGEMINRDIEHLYHNQFNSDDITQEEERIVEEIAEFILSIRNDLASNIPGEFFHSKKEKQEFEETEVKIKQVINL